MQKEIKIGDIAHASFWSQYISVEVLDIKRKWWALGAKRYWCKYKVHEGGYGVTWFRRSRLIQEVKND